MKFTAEQIKTFVKKTAKGNSTISQITIRNYIMERFLERLSLSEFKNKFILKGGLLIASIVGLDTRATMDIDTTAKNLSLSVQTATEIITKIISIPIDDGVSFVIKDVSVIMDDAEYNGVRASLEATIDAMRTPLKIDISTGDTITPGEIDYKFNLMFEDRSIVILAYNIESVLAEKLETVISRGTANTRLRDFYDIYILQNIPSQSISHATLKAAFAATCSKRNSTFLLVDGSKILSEIETSLEMQKLWLNYQKKFSYANDISWETVMQSIRDLFKLTTS